MKKAALLMIILLPVFYGCEKPVLEIKEFPVLRTLSVTDIDSTGATFTGEFLTDGSSTVTSYGFVWANVNPLIGRSDSVVSGKQYQPGVFKARIDRSLAAGVDYQVRAYATTSGFTVYGDTIPFRSKGSSHGKWSLEASFLSEGISDGKGCSIGGTGYVSFCWSQFYAYDPEKKVMTKLNSIPIPSTASTPVLPVSAGNSVYLFTQYSNKLLKYADGYWSVQSAVPFGLYQYEGSLQVMAVSDTIYILSSFVSYMYDIKNNTWTAKAPLPPSADGYSAMGTSYGRRAYVVTSNGGLYEYDTATDKWTKISVFPGDVKEKFISFALDNKLYFGFSKIDDSEVAGRRLWCYDILRGTWQPGEPFPEIPQYDLFGFTISGKFYMGTGAPYSYRIWKYDPGK